MNRILIVLTFLAAGAGAFCSARQNATRLQQKLQSANESWQIHTQHHVAAQSEQAALTERVRELKQTLAQSKPVTGYALWPVLQKNRADHLPPELRQRLLEELGFTWRSSPDFIVVSKQSVRDLQMQAVRDGKLTEMVATVLAMTPQERGQIEAALERARADFKDWVLARVERREPADEVLAYYTLPKEPAILQSISNTFTATILEALGRERAELVLPTAQSWMKSIGLYDCDAKPMMMIVKRSLAGNEQRLKVELSYPDVKGGPLPMNLRNPMGKFVPFPRFFRPLFPNGWADVAKREGFELPEESQKK